MRQLKKHLVISLVLILFSLVGCGPKGEQRVNTNLLLEKVPIFVDPNVPVMVPYPAVLIDRSQFIRLFHESMIARKNGLIH